VPEGDKAGLVRVFKRCQQYDVMNDAMSLASYHRIWKDAMMDWLASRSGKSCWMWR
jgi:demethylmenaquinone methyltransferase/2-methoxy-6-polyprenyl-1,4-benzoquinol methylase